MAHLLVTNDFPPKIGGIQSYLWELWRRLPAGRATVLTTPYAGADAFDAAAPMRIVRSRQKVLLPTPGLAREIVGLAKAVHTDLVVLDPGLPLGALGPSLRREGLRYAVVLHGAEVTVPGRLPVSRALLARVLHGAEHVIAAGGYPLAEAERAARRSLPATVIAPGVDVERFRPCTAGELVEVRARLGLPAASAGPLVVATSRLVPRKGIDVVLRAGGRLRVDYPGLVIAVSGAGRDRPRLERIAAEERVANGLDVRFLGRLSDDDLAALYRVGDVHAMLCRNRWGGMEQEGFGIVFVEAAASGVPQVAGRSGGAHEAVVNGVTGIVVDNPRAPAAVAAALREVLGDPERRSRMAVAGRRRAVAELSYDVLAGRLDTALGTLEAHQQRPGLSCLGPDAPAGRADATE